MPVAGVLLAGGTSFGTTLPDPKSSEAYRGMANAKAGVESEPDLQSRTGAQRAPPIPVQGEGSRECSRNAGLQEIYYLALTTGLASVWELSAGSRVTPTAARPRPARSRTDGPLRSARPEVGVVSDVPDLRKICRQRAPERNSDRQCNTHEEETEAGAVRST